MGKCYTDDELFELLGIEKGTPVQFYDVSEYENNSRLFNVLHPNGDPWTNDEVENYIREHDYNLVDFWTFVIDDERCLYILDECGMTAAVNPDDFKVEFNIDEVVQINE